MDGKNRKDSAAFLRLRQEIQGLERHQTFQNKRIIKLGVDDIEACLPDRAFPTGVIHEVIGDGKDAKAAATAFTAAMMFLIGGSKGCHLWVTTKLDVYAPALSYFGISPENVVFVKVKSPSDILSVVEDGLRFKYLTTVIAEISDIDITATKRLQVAVQDTGLTGFLLRDSKASLSTTACWARWRVSPIPSVSDEGMPGLGFPAWKIELLKMKNGRTGIWPLSWQDGAFKCMPPISQFSEMACA